MFLRPHQFQASERYWSEALYTSEKFDHPYQYGLRSIEINPTAVANNHFQANNICARMPEGTIIDLHAGQEPDRIDLKPALDAESTIRVYLAVPKLRLGLSNVARGQANGAPRFSETSLELQDESSGGGEQEIQFRRLNVRFLLSTQDLSGYEVLPIAQIRRVGGAEGAPVLDKDYIPPLLAVESWQALANDFLRDVYDMIGNRITRLSEDAVHRGMALGSQVPGHLEVMLMLKALNEIYATLGCLTFAQGVHPFDLYFELCRIVGRLSVFGPSRRVDNIPRYDHDELAPIFKWLKEKIIALMNTQDLLSYEQRYFIGEGQGMQVVLESKWFDPDWNWYIGVDPGNISERECRELLSVGRLDWKMGSNDQVERIFQFGAPGVQLVPLPQTPRALPAGEWIYYEIDRDSEAFRQVQATQTLAMRFKRELIVNLDSLAGQKKLIVTAGPKNAVLQFALFAVPSQR